MLIKRRTFLQSGSLATASLLLPRFLKAFERPAMVPPGNKVLVVLQMSGGNDGLNTVIPTRNDIYYRSRPHLGISRDQALRLTDEAGLHPALPDLKDLFDQGELAILNSVGYPNPDRSHFRSMDIWQSASDSRDYVYSGWLGRYLDAQCDHCERPTQALEIDDVLSLAMKGNQIKGLATRDPARLFHNSDEKYFRDLSQAFQPSGGTMPIDYLYKTMSETLSSANYLYKESRLRPSNSNYPATELAKSLQTIASLIFSDINTRVYYVSLGSFDTHVAQEGQQKRLFAEMNDAIKAFCADLKKNGRFDDVLMMTFSEFGRRVAQNASGGTDHGTANNMFLMGGALKDKGLLNELPDLTHLKEGDLVHQVDFKSVYATVLRRWLEADDRKILGQEFPILHFV